MLALPQIYIGEMFMIFFQYKIKGICNRCLALGHVLRYSIVSLLGNDHFIEEKLFSTYEQNCTIE